MAQRNGAEQESSSLLTSKAECKWRFICSSIHGRGGEAARVTPEKWATAHGLQHWQAQREAAAYFLVGLMIMFIMAYFK
jgi:hypothetical protein